MWPCHSYLETRVGSNMRSTVVLSHKTRLLPAIIIINVYQLAPLIRFRDYRISINHRFKFPLNHLTSRSKRVKL